MITLTEYQEKIIELGLETVRKHGLLYLMLKTRTGKTPISLKIAEQLSDEVLFITTKKMLKQLPAEIEKFGIKNKVTGCSMDSLHKIDKFTGIIIVDEAHSFGSYNKRTGCKRQRELKRITGNNKIIFLSATPTPESWTQIYYQLAVTKYSPFSEYKNFYAWCKDFVNVKKKYLGAMQCNDYSDAKIDKIKPYIDPISISLTQEQAGFKFANPCDMVINIKFADETKIIFNTLLKDNLYDDGFIEVVADSAVMLLSKLHQLCGGTIIDSEGIKHFVDLAKIEYINENLNNIKIAIYYKFIEEYEMLKKYLKKPTTESAYEFNSEDNIIYLSQFRSGREGVDLRTADALVFYNIDHAYLSYEQTKNRIQNLHRETNPVIMFLISDLGMNKKAESLDKRIYDMVVNKKKYTVKHFERDFLC